MMETRKAKTRSKKIENVRWDPIIARLEEYKLKF
jgi:hypothetical protein